MADTWRAPLINTFSSDPMDSGVPLLSAETRQWGEQLDKAVVAGTVQRLHVYLEFRDASVADPTLYSAGSLDLLPGRDWRRALYDRAVAEHWPDTSAVLVPEHPATVGEMAPGAHRVPVAPTRLFLTTIENPAAPAEQRATALAALACRLAGLAKAAEDLAEAAAREAARPVWRKRGMVVLLRDPASWEDFLDRIRLATVSDRDAARSALDALGNHLLASVRGGTHVQGLDRRLSAVDRMPPGPRAWSLRVLAAGIAYQLGSKREKVRVAARPPAGVMPDVWRTLRQDFARSRREIRACSWRSETDLVDSVVSAVLHAIAAVAFARCATLEEKRAAAARQQQQLRCLDRSFSRWRASEAAARAACAAPGARTVQDQRDDYSVSPHQLRARNAALPQNGHVAASAPSLARADAGSEDGPACDDGDLVRTRPFLARLVACRQLGQPPPAPFPRRSPSENCCYCCEADPAVDRDRGQQPAPAIPERGATR